MTQHMCAHDGSQQILARGQLLAEVPHQDEPTLRKQSNCFMNYKHNRVSSVVDMSNESNEDSDTCFCVVADPLITTKIIATYLERGVPTSVETIINNLNVPLPKTSPLCGTSSCDDRDDDRFITCNGNPMYKEIHVLTKECSVSSGVASGESSGQDSPIPKCTTTSSNRQSCTRNLFATENRPILLSVVEDSNDGGKTRTQSTQTDEMLSSLPVVCKHSNVPPFNRSCGIRSSLDSSSNSSRLDSGFSSPSFTSLHRFRCTKNDCQNCENLFDTCSVKTPRCSSQFSKVDSEKEECLARLKRKMFDPEKERYIKQIKDLLRESGHESFKNQLFTSPWKPVKKCHSQHLVPSRGVLKHNRDKLLEEIHTRHNMKVIERSRKEKRMLCPFKRQEAIDIIKQVRQCLEITKQQRARSTISQFQYNFQVRRKIKLKSFPSKKANMSHSGDLSDNDTLTNYSIHLDYFSTILQNAAGRGDVKEILEVINRNPTILRDVEDRSGAHPPLHHALKKHHYRTAILLLEAGTNLVDYTEKRVNEYQQMMEIVRRNKKNISY